MTKAPERQRHDVITAVLDAVVAAPTAGMALDAIPEDWEAFVTGPEDGEFACGLKPPGVKGPIGRLYDRGIAQGRGDTRLNAMRAAALWTRRTFWGMQQRQRTQGGHTGNG